MTHYGQLMCAWVFVSQVCQEKQVNPKRRFVLLLFLYPDAASLTCAVSRWLWGSRDKSQNPSPDTWMHPAWRSHHPVPRCHSAAAVSLSLILLWWKKPLEDRSIWLDNQNDTHLKQVFQAPTQPTRDLHLKTLWCNMLLSRDLFDILPLMCWAK